MEKTKKEPTMEELSFKYGLTIEEATRYFGIGRVRLEDVLSEHQELFIMNGVKKLVKRKRFEEFFDSTTVI